MKVLIFEILKKLAIPPGRNEKYWNEEIIYSVYATEKNF
jgi:hypothetical protein